MKHLSISSFEMKRFFRNIVWCSIPVLLFFVVVEFVVRSVPNDYKYKWSYLENHSSEIEVLVLGNSQSYYGVDCKVLRCRSFNMAMEGQGLLIDDYVLESFIGKMSNLKTVIVPMSYVSLTQPAAFGTPGRLMQYHIYYGYDSKWYSINDYECLNFLLCSTKIRALVSGKGLINVDSLGFCAHVMGGFNDEADETLSWATNDNSSLVESNMNALVRMADCCSRNGVNLMLVTFPVEESYWNSTFFQLSQMEQVQRFAERLSQEYENVTMIDWFDNSDFNNSDFFDSSHLNAQGAKKLTRMLGSKLEK